MKTMDKIRSIISYLSLLLVALAILAIGACSTPVSVGFQDEGIKGSYSAKGGVELVVDLRSNK